MIGTSATRNRGIRSHRFQDGLESPRPALDGRTVEEVHGVFEPAREVLAVLPEEQRQVELGGAPLDGELRQVEARQAQALLREVGEGRLEERLP